jgi:hypothetical protein
MRSGGPEARLRQPARRNPTLIFVGDILLAGRVSGIITRGGPAAPFAGVTQLLRGADLAVGNLECSLSRRGEAMEEKDYTFRGRPQDAAALQAGGLGLVTLANNHAGDYGKPALLDTVAACRKHGLSTVGAGRNLTEARTPASVSVGSLIRSAMSTRMQGTTRAGGCFLTIFLLVGFLYGLSIQNPLKGTLIGLAIGAILAIATWLIDRARRGS